MSQVQIESGVCGYAQEASFQNGTLQGDQDRDFDFTVQTYIDVPEGISGEIEVADYLGDLLRAIARDHPEVTFHVQVGPWGDGKEDD